jgi:signal transduction histidine kinase
MYRLRQLHKFYNMRNNIARDLHDDVGSALSSILIGSQLIKRITPDDDDQKHHIIDSINKASSQTISNMSDIVWSLNPANDTGEKILNKMREVAFQLLEQQNIRVLFNCDTSFDLLLLNMDVRRNIFLIFKESIHNIAKYAQAKNVTISLIIKNQDLNICISDDGVGFILSDKTVGNGLQNMQIRANQMQAQFQVLSDIGKGTTIILHAPITKIR